MDQDKIQEATAKLAEAFGVHRITLGEQHWLCTRHCTWRSGGMHDETCIIKGEVMYVPRPDDGADQ
jgi:hypothetical protein